MGKRAQSESLSELLTSSLHQRSNMSSAAIAKVVEMVDALPRDAQKQIAEHICELIPKLRDSAQRDNPSRDSRKGTISTVQKVNPEALQARQSVSETAVVSEQALAEDWNRPEEDVAWARFQLAR